MNRRLSVTIPGVLLFDFLALAALAVAGDQ